MFLNGSLENFSVADILQLLSFSRQSGALYVQGAVDAVLYLEDGDAYFARRDSDSPLGDILFAHGVDESDWTGAVAESAARDAIGETLVTRGAIDGDLLAYVVHRQLTDTLFDLFRMPRRGTFDFRVGERHEIGAIRRYKVDALIDDTRRRVEEWATISEFISSPSAMVSIATELPADRVELTLDRQQWALLLLAAREDRSTLTEMAHVLERTDAEVAGALDGLIRAGLVTILEMQAPVFEEDAAAGQPDRVGHEAVDETSWAEADEEVKDSIPQWVEADQPGGEEPAAETDAPGSELDHSSASDDPLSSDWFETEIGSWTATPADDAEEAGTWQEATTDENAGDEAESWQTPPLPEGTEGEIGGWSPIHAGTGDESADWQEPVPLFEDPGPDTAAEGAEGAESWWQEAPAGETSSPEWEHTWRPTQADGDAPSAPEWLAAPEEPAVEEGDLSDSIWGDASESPTARADADDADGGAPSMWDAPAAGDVSWTEPEDGESSWTSDERDHEPIWNPDPDVSPEPPPAPVAEAQAGGLSDAPSEAEPPEAASGEPSNAPETSDGESSGFRTVALQELRNLAGVAGTPVRLPGSARRQAGSGDTPSQPSPAPKIRALKRLIAAVRGL